MKKYLQFTDTYKLNAIYTMKKNLHVTDTYKLKMQDIQ